VWDEFIDYEVGLAVLYIGTEASGPVACPQQFLYYVFFLSSLVEKNLMISVR